jgi:hypothetical protein
MMVSLLANQVLCAAATLGVVLASYQAASVSASGTPAHVEAPAAQSVNRAAKGDRLKSPPRIDSDKAITPNGAPAITVGQYKVAAATRACVCPSIPDLLFTLRILPEPDLIATDGRQS